MRRYHILKRYSLAFLKTRLISRNVSGTTVYYTYKVHADVNGKQSDISQGEYNQMTHFNNTDTNFPYDMM